MVLMPSLAASEAVTVFAITKMDDESNDRCKGLLAVFSELPICILPFAAWWNCFRSIPMLHNFAVGEAIQIVE